MTGVERIQSLVQALLLLRRSETGRMIPYLEEVMLEFPELVVVGGQTPRGGLESGNALAGSVLETTYLGELAQHVVELKPLGDGAKPQRLKVALLNPAPADHAAGPARPILLRVAPEDVVLVPA